MGHDIRRKLQSKDPEDEVLLCVKCGATAVAIDRDFVSLILGIRFLEWKPLGSDHTWISREREPWWDCEEEDGEAAADG